MNIPKARKNHFKNYLVVKKASFVAKYLESRLANSEEALLLATLESAQMKSLYPFSSL
jgi:hypothetical protein